MMIASKFDEIDYNLIQAKYIISLLWASKNLSSFANNFTPEDMASCEEEILKNILKWNVYHINSDIILKNILN